MSENAKRTCDLRNRNLTFSQIVRVKMNITERQKNVLLQFMREHEDIARGKMRYTRKNKERLDDMWWAITTLLNNTGIGPQKGMKEWRKTWQDWRENVLRKYAMNQIDASNTGGQILKVTNLTEMEQNLLSIVDPNIQLPSGEMKMSNVNYNTPVSSIPHAIPITVFQVKTEPAFSMSEEATGAFPATGGVICHNTDSRAQTVNDIRISHVYSANGMEKLAEKRNAPIAAQVIGKKLTQKKKPAADSCVQLMREELKIKRQKLQISKEKLQLEREKFEFMQMTSSQGLSILRSINENLSFLAQEVEKIAPSYLEQ